MGFDPYAQDKNERFWRNVREKQDASRNFRDISPKPGTKNKAFAVAKAQATLSRRAVTLPTLKCLERPLDD